MDNNYLYDCVNDVEHIKLKIEACDLYLHWNGESVHLGTVNVEIVIKFLESSPMYEMFLLRLH